MSCCLLEMASALVKMLEMSTKLSFTSSIVALAAKNAMASVVARLRTARAFFI